MELSDTLGAQPEVYSILGDARICHMTASAILSSMMDAMQWYACAAVSYNFIYEYNEYNISIDVLCVRGEYTSNGDGGHSTYVMHFIYTQNPCIYVLTCV